MASTNSMNVVKPKINLSDPKLLELVNKLRDLGVGQHVALPQLVVVGDQSSGKSSLLESLTGVPFPQDQNLCTRYATQITSRCGPDESVHVRIIAGPQATDEHKRMVESFRIDMTSVLGFYGKFPEILKKANDKMGIRIDISSGEGVVFSKDILKIEIQGPKEDLLTIIDVPGIFRATTKGTTKDDMDMIRDMVRVYIKDKRTIILAVLPSNVDIATQEILELAAEYDKKGTRTLGILTKPDLVLESSAQDSVCSLVSGAKRPLALGYYLVRNRGADAGLMSPSELDYSLRKMPWSSLPQDRVGIKALKSSLKLLLAEITQKEFPGLLRDLSKSITQSKVELDNLGPQRQDEREQRLYLNGIAGAFQDRAREALNADYNASPDFVQVDMRLITNVVNITDVFSTQFRLQAHSRDFGTNKLSQDLGELAIEPHELEHKEASDGDMINVLQALLKETKAYEPTDHEIAELGDIIVTRESESPPHGTVTEWIKHAYLENRGMDLGTFSPNMVSIAFSEQSKNWGVMAREYMAQIILVLHRFIAEAIRSVCSDEHTRAHLWTSIVDRLIRSYKEAIDQASLLVEVERNKQPYTLNRQFSDARARARSQRVKALLYGRARKDTRQYGEVQLMVNLDDIETASLGKSNMEQLQDEIHDIVQAYYSIALERFMDNIFQLAIDHCLLRGPSSPLKVFNQNWVVGLEPDELKRIVGESSTARNRRKKLTKKIDDLQKALAVVKEFMDCANIGFIL